jgi:MerR family transcriptional regulator, copper efflux regulator
MRSLHEETFTISEAARSAGLGVETVRFYEREGLLKAPARSGSGYRQFTPADVRRLAFVRRAKTLGFSLREIKELLALTAHRRTNVAKVKAFAQAKAERLREQIRDLQKIETALQHLVDECSGSGPANHCPILNAILLEEIGAGADDANQTKKRR